MNLYFKRYWDETTGNSLTEKWGTSVYFFETNQSGEVLRQLEIYENGQRLKYTIANLQDNYGGLSEVPLDLEEFKQFEITKDAFEDAWQQ